MNVEIKLVEAKTFIGMNIETSLENDNTAELFKTFMPRRNEIKAPINQNILDLKVYPIFYFQQFSTSRTFIKWALIEVKNTELVPENMDVFHLSSGKYATFKHSGYYTDTSPFEYIYGEWLPKSGYELDDLPHFDILNTKNKNEEQDIWIPIK
jgi:AraC family transcriptional regulator